MFVVCRQEYYMQEGRHGHGSRGSKGPGTINKIREALNLMRNQKFEVCNLRRAVELLLLLHFCRAC